MAKRKEKIIEGILYKSCDFCNTFHPWNKEFWHIPKPGASNKQGSSCLIKQRIKDKENYHHHKSLNSPRFQNKKKLSNEARARLYADPDRANQTREKAAQKRKPHLKKLNIPKKEGHKWCINHQEFHILTKEFWIPDRNRPYGLGNCRTHVNRQRTERRKNDPEFKAKTNAATHKSIKKRKKENPALKLSFTIRSRLYRFVKGQISSSEALWALGCSREELKDYIENKFQEGMMWSNHGQFGWHLDHIIPLSSFDLLDNEQFKKACHYSNLQPLWWYDNLKKSNKS